MTKNFLKFEGKELNITWKELELKVDGINWLEEIYLNIFLIKEDWFEVTWSFQISAWIWGIFNLYVMVSFMSRT